MITLLPLSSLKSALVISSIPFYPNVIASSVCRNLFCMVKVKFILQKAMKAQRRSRGTVKLYLQP
jgi:hypothetical protein